LFPTRLVEGYRSTVPEEIAWDVTERANGEELSGFLKALPYISFRKTDFLLYKTIIGCIVNSFLSEDLLD